MRNYKKLLGNILLEGDKAQDRTGVGTKSGSVAQEVHWSDL